MSHFDTLTRDDTLILSQALGLNRQIMIKGIRIQHVNPYAQKSGMCNGNSVHHTRRQKE